MVSHLHKQAKPSLLQYNGIQLKEFPINTHQVFKPLIFFRWVVISFVALCYCHGPAVDYVMTYFHPRDFDYEQPVVLGFTTQTF